MVQIITPETEGFPLAETETAVFLAGGISGCPDWQRTVGQWLTDTNLVLLNPRREHYPDDPDAARAQITWEYGYLRRADAVLFWFPCETLCPITLFELGTCSRTETPLFVGTHPDYSRKNDVLIQLSLARPEITVADSLHQTVEMLRAWHRAGVASTKGKRNP